MKIKKKNESRKSKKWSLSKSLNLAAAIVAILMVASISNNVYLFSETVKQYVAQGYPAYTVITQLLSSQLLPGIFEPIAIYGGMVILLLSVKIVNNKVSRCLELLTQSEITDIKDNKLEDDVLISDKDNAYNHSKSRDE
ncbi:hypothetical protein [Clostridium fermenticellae]|uniref:hypothetical protein n=1 Tax=Clostridium fermenticellae TaxID=2068654 RepID=UPI0018F8A67D|nr:hypothetical protein [Clostridium fermenticellae]